MTKLLGTVVLAVSLLAVPTVHVFADTGKTTTIKTSVQNQTTNDSLSDANDAGTAVMAKTGDILKYVIEIKNDADKSEDGNNDLTAGTLTDTLPAGVELVSSPDKREVTDDFGTIKPGDTVTKQFLAKVTAGKDGETVENRGCFTGEYAKQNKPLSSCNSAFIKIDLDGKDHQQQPTPAPTQPQQPTPTPSASDLPTTGPANFVAPVAAVITGILAYTLRLAYVQRFKHS